MQLATINLIRTGLTALAMTASLSTFAQDVPQAVKDSISRAEAAIAKIVAVRNDRRSFENTLGAFDALSTTLDTETSLFIFMQNVSTSAAERDSARAAEQLLSDWYTDTGKREDLYRAIKAYADTKPKLDGEQARLLEFTLRDYRRAGMDLPKDKRDKLAEIEKELNKVAIEFDQNIADDETKVLFTADELKGVPADALAKQLKFNDVYLLGLDYPTLDAVLMYCTVPASREKMWVANRRKGGERNVRVLEKMLKLRAQAAKLLGYASTVDFELEPRMAKNAATVKKFYDELRPIVRKKAQIDFEEFTAAKRADLKDPKAIFNPWDYGFYKERQRQRKYSLDSVKVSEYFPLDRVLKGLFEITSSLYNIEFKDVTADASKLGLPIWYPDVKLYEVVDKSSKEVLGRLYTDLFPRPNKYSHAACWNLQPRRVWEDGTVQKPLTALVCNFTKPTADKPSLLPHAEVATLFHEFGHGLHNLLSQTRYGRFSGTQVARDFVEAPSQMMENWVWSPTVLKTFARHYKTNQPIPDKMIEGMLRARTLGSGMETQGQLYLGDMDQAFHLAPNGEIDTTKTALEIYARDTMYGRTFTGTFPQASFGHLTGYQGAYYGYLWSLVYASDMFQRFEELGVLSPKTGAYYREKVLSRGGSMDEAAMLRDYLNREPKMDAFLKHLGLSK